MPRLTQITIENFRSIGNDPITVNFPDKQPLILIGENNAGKSNIIRAIDLMFGEFHPKYRKLDDYDYYQRNPDNEIHIDVNVTDYSGRLGRYGEFSCGGFVFQTKKREDNDFFAVQFEDGERNNYVSNNLREELLCVVVNSEQNLNYQLSYSSKYTLLSKVTKSFHDRLTEDEDRIHKLKCLYDNIQSIFLEVEEFGNFKDNMSQISGEMLSNMTHALNFNFHFSLYNRYPWHDLKVPLTKACSKNLQ